MGFQLADDLLDITGDEKKVGKKLRKDSGNQSPNAVLYFGLDAVRARIDELLPGSLRPDRRARHRFSALPVPDEEHALSEPIMALLETILSPADVKKLSLDELARAFGRRSASCWSRWWRRTAGTCRPTWGPST